jgi:hypothetical protein
MKQVDGNLRLIPDEDQQEAGEWNKRQANEIFHLSHMKKFQTRVCKN